MRLAHFAVVGAALGSAGALAGAAPAPPEAPAAPTSPAAAPPSGSGCFYTRDIVGHQIADGSTLYLRTRSNAVYRLDMSGACLAGHANDDPLIMHEPPGVQYVCRAVDLDLAIGRAGMPPGVGVGTFKTPCIVKTLKQLTPAQVAALPPRSRP